MSIHKLPDDLYDFQKIDSLKAASPGNWMLLHRMRMGKTPMSINVVEHNKHSIPLIICPNSLRLEWSRQIAEWTDEKCAVSVQNTYARLKNIIHSLTDGTKYKVINYETLRNKENFQLLTMIPFDIIIFDEVHQVRNPKTQLTKAVWDFLKSQPQAKILALSGSPIMNYPNDLYVPLSMVNPQEYSPTQSGWREFMYRYCLWAEGRNGTYIYGTRNMAELRERTAPLMIRRTEEEARRVLPEKRHQRVELVMAEDQRKLYNQMETELRVMLDTGEPLWSPSVLATLTRLRQINLDPRILGITCSSAKSEFLKDTVEGMLEGQTQVTSEGLEKVSVEKLVIFSCFEGYVDILSKAYFPHIPHVVVSGTVDPDERIKRVQQFQTDPSIKLFLGTIKTGGQGIPLDAASVGILTDRWWNSPTNTQAEDRLLKLHKKSAVHIYLPVVKDSIDELLDEILKRKHESSQEFYSEDDVRHNVLGSLLGHF